MDLVHPAAEGVDLGVAGGALETARQYRAGRVRGEVAAGPDDPEPRLLAGMVIGVEMAVIELWGRSGLELPELFEAAEASVPDLVRQRRAGRS